MKDKTKLKEKLLAKVSGAGEPIGEKINVNYNDNREPLCPFCSRVMSLDFSEPRINFYGCDNCEKVLARYSSGEWRKLD